jgi:hypothetical protein
MCDKCAELDKNIEHYERMLLSVGDQITVEHWGPDRRFAGAKATLHPAKQ